MGVLGCDRPTPEGAKPSNGASDDVVAKIGASTLTVADVEARLAEQPEFVRARYSTVERKREFVDTLVTNELLVQEAKRQHLDDDAAVRSALERALIQRLLQQEVSNAPVTEAAVKGFYDANVEQFVRPERLRVSHVFFASPKTDAKHAQLKAEAARELSQLMAVKPEVRAGAFAAAVKRRSNDEVSKPQDGDLGLRTIDELRQAWGEAVAEAATALQAPGDVSAVVESEKGFHLIRLAGRQVGTTESVEQATPRITARLEAESRAKRLEALVAKLKGATPVEVKSGALERVKVQVPSTLLDGAAPTTK
ncbi:MAG: peptidyl-prolyl cis-trans isomerase [Archangium sp.]|nr:peptidyl-prolyl cis-trans isomerase [Archangium sp.]